MEQDSGTRAPGIGSRSWAATSTKSFAWRSRRTAGGWPPAATTAPCGSGTPTPDVELPFSGGTKATFTRWRSRPTAGDWPPVSTDGTVRLWDVDTGRELFILRGHKGRSLPGVLARRPALATAELRRHHAALGRGDRPRAGRLPRDRTRRSPARRMPLHIIQIPPAQAPTRTTQLSLSRRIYRIFCI